MTYTEEIKKLLDSDITSYKIAKCCDISPQFVDNYRIKGYKIGNMTLKKAEKLVSYQKEIDKMNALNLKSNLTKKYMDSLMVIDTVIDYLDDNGIATGLRSYALVYLDNDPDLDGNYDVLAEPYSLEHDIDGNVNVHWYNRELPESYVIV